MDSSADSRSNLDVRVFLGGGGGWGVGLGAYTDKFGCRNAPGYLQLKMKLCHTGFTNRL